MSHELEKLVKGKVVQCNDERGKKIGQFLLVETSLSDIKTGETSEEAEIQKITSFNRQYLDTERIKTFFPELHRIHPGSMLFWDTETCGLVNEPIFMIGGARISGGRGVHITTLVARDYSEEPAILYYFLRQVLPNFRAIATYNGKSFDIPILIKRARSFGLLNSHESTSYEQIFNREFGRIIHVDLFYPVRRILVPRILPDAKLSTFERLILEHTRFQDVPGVKIPRIYSDYLNCQDLEREGDNVERMAHVVHHNQLDTASLIATFAYLCSGAWKKAG